MHACAALSTCAYARQCPVMRSAAGERGPGKIGSMATHIARVCAEPSCCERHELHGVTAIAEWPQGNMTMLPVRELAARGDLWEPRHCEFSREELTAGIRAGEPMIAELRLPWLDTSPCVRAACAAYYGSCH